MFFVSYPYTFLFTLVMMLTSLVMLSSLMMLAPLRAMAELAVAFAKLMMMIIVGIDIVSRVVVAVIGIVVVTISGVIPCTAGQHYPDQDNNSPSKNLSFIHLNHSLSD